MNEQEHYNDEISLTDLAKVLVSRKKTFYFVFVSFVTLGILTAFLLPQKFSYTTTIEIGQRLENGHVKLIDEPSTLLVKISKTYIPLAQQTYLNNNPGFKGKLELKSAVPKKSQIIVLTAKGGEGEQPVYKEISKRVVDEVVEDHNRLLKVLKKQHELGLLSINNQILSLKQEISIYKQDLNRLEKNEVLIREQVKNIAASLKQSFKNRSQASSNIRNESNAMTLLMIDNDIQQNRNRLFALEQQLAVEINNKKDTINKKISDAYRNIAEKKDALILKKIQLENLRETRALSVAMKSVGPVGLSQKLIVLLSVFVGFFMSFFSVYLHEFVINIKKDLSEKV